MCGQLVIHTNCLRNDLFQVPDIYFTINRFELSMFETPCLTIDVDARLKNAGKDVSRSTETVLSDVHRLRGARRLHVRFQFAIYALMTWKTTELYTARCGETTRSNAWVSTEPGDRRLWRGSRSGYTSGIRKRHIIVSGCWFHYAQALMKRLKRLVWQTRTRMMKQRRWYSDVCWHCRCFRLPTSTRLSTTSRSWCRTTHRLTLIHHACYDIRLNYITYSFVILLAIDYRKSINIYF